MTNTQRAYVIGVGMTDFKRCDTDVKELAQAAVRLALQDAGIAYDAVEQAYAGYINGMSTLGQQSLYGIGMTGIPVFNVNNNCSTGSTALYLAYNEVRSGMSDCVLAFGFEEMQPGALASHWDDRESPFASFLSALDRDVGLDEDNADLDATDDDLRW